MDGSADSEVRDGQAGMPTYSLPRTGVVIPLAAAALKLNLQLHQNLQLPFDGVSSWEVAWHVTQAFQVADVVDIVQGGQPRRKRYLQAHRNTRLVTGVGLELVVWSKSSLLEASEPGLSLLLAARVWSCLDRELSLTELGH